MRHGKHFNFYIPISIFIPLGHRHFRSKKHISIDLPR